jgi:hypothetical protein
VGEDEHLFRAPAEHEGVSALQPHDTLAAPGCANHETVDGLLFDTGSTGALAHAEALGLRQAAERVGVHQGVVQHEIGLFNASKRANRPELGVARTSTDQ